LKEPFIYQYVKISVWEKMVVYKIMKENLQEYNIPELYDVENGSLHDLALLEEYADKGGVNIDLACGTGRATIPLAEKGYNIIGVDIHEGMLSRAQEKTKNPLISWVKQNLKGFKLDVTSQFIYMVGNSFQHFLTNEDQDRLLQSVHAHLSVDGVFIFDTRFPSKEELLQPETEEYWRSFADHLGREVDVSTIAVYDALTQIQSYQTMRRYQERDGSVSKTESRISLRYVYPAEMDRLLANHGFSVVHRYQDWRKTELTSEATNMVYVCRKR